VLGETREIVILALRALSRCIFTLNVLITLGSIGGLNRREIGANRQESIHYCSGFCMFVFLLSESSILLSSTLYRPIVGPVRARNDQGARFARGMSLPQDQLFAIVNARQSNGSTSSASSSSLQAPGPDHVDRPLQL
jgi:hypothetical protein